MNPKVWFGCKDCGEMATYQVQGAVKIRCKNCRGEMEVLKTEALSEDEVSYLEDKKRSNEGGVK